MSGVIQAESMGHGAGENQLVYELLHAHNDSEAL